VALEQTRFTVSGLNPNDVATFIVVLILSMPILLKWSKYWIWFVWPVETILFALLVGTGSRGGVLALICGFIVSLILCWRKGLLPKNWKTWTSIGLAVALGVGAGLAAFPKGFRIGTVDVSPEASAGRRLEVWSTVPAMLASAPNGWGLGNAAEAYEQWFEPVGEAVPLKHLLSSHFTWLVEFGWPLRWLYLFLWMAAIVLLLSSRTFNFPLWGVAVWTAFFVALFYNAAGKWWNWPLPAFWVIAALILRFKQKASPAQSYCILSAVAAGILVGLPFILMGLHTSKLSVVARDGGNIVLVGAGKPTLVILGPNKDVLGNFYGQEVRKEWSKVDQDSGSIIIVTEPDASAGNYLADCHLYVISGADEAAIKKWESIFTPRPGSRLLLINCRVELDDWIKTFGGVAYCRGEFYGDPFYNEWKDFSTSRPAVLLQDIPQSETYIEDWWPLVAKAMTK
jgi:energy-converting hydrogenase Eha subunit B